MIPLRALGALAALVSAAVHFWELVFNGYSALQVVGPAFIINVVAGVVIAALLLTWRHWIPFFLLFGLGLLTLAGFVTAATVGLYGVHEQWSGFPIWAAAIAEAVAILLGGAVTAGARKRRARPAR